MPLPAKPVLLYVDADACPVKEQVYKVAERYGLKVFVVANAYMQVPRTGWIERVVVPAGPDIADDWIAERAGPGDVVITADIPLASRCLKNGAAVIGTTGKEFTQASIGLVLATRNLMQNLRETGEITGGPPPFSGRDRSAFLSTLDQVVTRWKRAGYGGQALFTPPAIHS